MPYARIVGDAGCFIDPYFSSGVHLALTGALSAAATIAASLRSNHPSLIPPPSSSLSSTKGEGGKETGQAHIEEATAAAWHSAKIGTAYTRFLLVVLSAYRQIRRQEQPVLADFDEDNFDRAFAMFRPGGCLGFLLLFFSFLSFLFFGFFFFFFFGFSFFVFTSLHVSLSFLDSCSFSSRRRKLKRLNRPR